jgi:hypothetical protein
MLPRLMPQKILQNSPKAFLQPKYLESSHVLKGSPAFVPTTPVLSNPGSLAWLLCGRLRLTSALLAQAKSGKNRCDDADEPVDKLLATSLGDYCPKLPKIAKNGKNDHHLRSRR